MIGCHDHVIGCLGHVIGCHVPIPGPAGVTVGAFAIEAATEMPVLARRADILAVLPEESRHAHLVALGAVPALLACHAAALRHLARLLALTVATSGGMKAARSSCGNGE